MTFITNTINNTNQFDSNYLKISQGALTRQTNTVNQINIDSINTMTARVINDPAAASLPNVTNQDIPIENVAEAAKQALLVATQRVLEADVESSAAHTLLATALTEKETVIKHNSTERINEVNQLIQLANTAIETAIAAKTQAQTALNQASKTILLLADDDANAELGSVLKQQLEIAVNDLNKVTPPQPITTQLGLEVAKTAWAALVDLVQNSLAYIKDLLTKISDTKPAQIINDLIDSAGAIAHSVAELIKRPFDKLIESSAIFPALIQKVLGITIKAIAEGIKVVLVDSVWHTITAIPGIIFKNIINVVINPLTGALQIAKDILFQYVGQAAKRLGEVASNAVKKIMEAFSVLGELGKDILTDLANATKNLIGNGIKSIFDFLKENFTDFLSNPIKYVTDIIKAVTSTIEDTIKIAMDFFKIPGDALNAIAKVIHEIIASIKGDQVVEKSGTQPELEHSKGADLPVFDKVLDSTTALIEAKTVNQTTDNLADIKLIATNKEGEINLDNVLPANASEAIIAQAQADVTPVANNPIIVLPDDWHSLSGLAA